MRLNPSSEHVIGRLGVDGGDGDPRGYRGLGFSLSKLRRADRFEAGNSERSERANRTAEDAWNISSRTRLSTLESISGLIRGRIEDRGRARHRRHGNSSRAAVCLTTAPTPTPTTRQTYVNPPPGWEIAYPSTWVLNASHALSGLGLYCRPGRGRSGGAERARQPGGSNRVAGARRLRARPSARW